jgi:hypothetical protein
MGVTAHFFAFDPRRCTAAPGIDRWIECGALDRELQVVGDARAWLKEILSPLGDNKRWYDNLAGNFAWSRARAHVDPAERAALDVWLSHLFWDAGDAGCPCGRTPTSVGEHEVVYDHPLLEHIVALARPLWPVEAGLEYEFAGDPPRSQRFDRPWIYDHDGFTELVLTWHQLMKHALRAGPGWSLLQWVSF